MLNMQNYMLSTSNTNNNIDPHTQIHTHIHTHTHTHTHTLYVCNSLLKIFKTLNITVLKKLKKCFFEFQ